MAAQTATATPSAPDFRPHLVPGASPFVNLRPTPARATSLSPTLASKLSAFAAGSGTGRWPHLPRAAMATRLTELTGHPDRIDQAGLNACGPAAAHHLFCTRFPERFADFAIALYDAGVAPFGTLTVKGDGLFAKDPAAMAWSPSTPPQLLDWMVLSATLRSAGTLLQFGGEPSDSASGISLPSEVTDWLRDGIGYTTVSNEANHFMKKGTAHLLALRPTASRHVVCLINVTNIQRAQSRGLGAVGEIIDGISGAVQAEFPNHWVVLEKDAVSSGGRIQATTWTWGRSGYVFDAPVSVWEDSYYGAIIADV
jgi:hypothetical protein